MITKKILLENWLKWHKDCPATWEADIHEWLKSLPDDEPEKEYTYIPCCKCGEQYRVPHDKYRCSKCGCLYFPQPKEPTPEPKEEVPLQQIKVRIDGDVPINEMWWVDMNGNRIAKTRIEPEPKEEIPSWEKEFDLEFPNLKCSKVYGFSKPWPKGEESFCADRVKDLIRNEVISKIIDDLLQEFEDDNGRGVTAGFKVVKTRWLRGLK